MKNNTEALSQAVADVTTPIGIRMPRNRGQGTKPLEFCVFSASHRQKILIHSCSSRNCPDVTIKSEKTYIILVYFRKKNQAKLNKRNIDFCSSPAEAPNFPSSQKSCTLSKLLTFQQLSLQFIRTYIPDVRNIINEVLQCWVKRWGGLKKDLAQECDHKWEGEGSNTDVLWNLELLCMTQSQNIPKY